TFLVNQVLLEEYRSIAAGSMPEKTKQKIWRSDYGVKLWQRASFALEKAKDAGQHLGDTTAIRATLLQQKAFLKKTDSKRFRELERFEEKHLTDPQWIEGTFSSEQNRKYFHALVESYAHKGEICSLKGEEFATAGKILTELTVKDELGNVKQLAEYLAKLPVDK